MVQTIGKMWSEDIKCLTFLLGQTQPGEKSLGVRETLDCTSLEVLKITTSPCSMVFDCFRNKQVHV